MIATCSWASARWNGGGGGGDKHNTCLVLFSAYFFSSGVSCLSWRPLSRLYQRAPTHGRKGATGGGVWPHSARVVRTPLRIGQGRRPTAIHLRDRAGNGLPDWAAHRTCSTPSSSNPPALLPAQRARVTGNVRRDPCHCADGADDAGGASCAQKLSVSAGCIDYQCLWRSFDAALLIPSLDIVSVRGWLSVSTYGRKEGQHNGKDGRPQQWPGQTAQTGDWGLWTR
ncbi:hypothetical protein EV126DRAFT_32076 [Verticillium dahliae]|nr:hypothetical protein EV126DRAFT_32076 [Verticillium dahliae]